MLDFYNKVLQTVQGSVCLAGERYHNPNFHSGAERYLFYIKDQDKFIVHVAIPMGDGRDPTARVLKPEIVNRSEAFRIYSAMEHFRKFPKSAMEDYAEN